MSKRHYVETLESVSGLAGKQTSMSKLAFYSSMMFPLYRQYKDDLANL